MQPFQLTLHIHADGHDATAGCRHPGDIQLFAQFATSTSRRRPAILGLSAGQRVAVIWRETPAQSVRTSLARKAKATKMKFVAESQLTDGRTRSMINLH